MSVQHDIWYFAVTATCDGEERGFSWQIRARPPRSGETIPDVVRTACEGYVAGIVDSSDLRDYHAVIAGERTDWPYRTASYTLSRNGREVVRSCAIRPIRPDFTPSR